MVADNSHIGNLWIVQLADEPLEKQQWHKLAQGLIRVKSFDLRPIEIVVIDVDLFTIYQPTLDLIGG